jgi:dienelactone hydrolase
MSQSFDTQIPVKVIPVPGSDIAAEYFLAQTIDGLYVPYVMRVPKGDGPFPFIFLAYGNGGVGFEWLEDRVHRFSYIMDKLLAEGYACAWGRYRAEVELGFHTGGKLQVDVRQGMQLMNRSPLEFEDEIAILENVKKDLRIDADRLGHIGVSHAGEMLFKIASQYEGIVKAGVACEPANHEFLALTPDHTTHINPATGLRDIEDMVMSNPIYVRTRIDEAIAKERIAAISTPMLVMGRDEDHLQGIFRTSYDLLEEAKKEAEWVSWDHDLHGYIFPVRNETGTIDVDEVQEAAIDGLIDYLDRYLK